jgi:hypothetical protein
VAGALLAGVGRPVVGAAAPGGNSAAAFCATVYGDTKAAGQCTSQAAQGTGPYYDCGGNPSNFCNGTCCGGGCPCIAAPAGACFWLDCGDYGGSCCWTLNWSLPFPSLPHNASEVHDAATCQALDSCSGGSGESRGGCFKWATSSC